MRAAANEKPGRDCNPAGPRSSNPVEGIQMDKINPTPEAPSTARASIDELSLKVSDVAGFSTVLHHLIDDFLGSYREARTDPANGCIRLQLYEAEMIIFMSNQTKWAAEAADKTCSEVPL